jgi:uncharacterized membrane protein YbaN (DUF454 family)
MYNESVQTRKRQRPRRLPILQDAAAEPPHEASLELVGPGGRGPVRKALLAGAGTVCVGVGLIGVVLPGVPTTPLLLLAAYLYARSSPRLHRRLLESRLLGPYLREYQERRALRPRVKAAAITLLWASIALAVYLAPWLLLRIFLVVVATGVTVLIISLPTLRPPR